MSIINKIKTSKTKHHGGNWKKKAVELGEILTEIRCAMKYKCYKDVITLLNDADKIKETE